MIRKTTLMFLGSVLAVSIASGAANAKSKQRKRAMPVAVHRST